MRSFTAGRTTPTALYTITPEARSAAQSSADSQPGPPISATEMPTKAAAEVIASERWCQASAETTVLPTDSPSRRTRRNHSSLTMITPTSTTRVNARGV